MAQIRDEKMATEGRTAWNRADDERDGKSVEKTALLAFDEQYPTFGPQPDYRFFSMPEQVNVRSLIIYK